MTTVPEVVELMLQCCPVDDDDDDDDDDHGDDDSHDLDQDVAEDAGRGCGSGSRGWGGTGTAGADDAGVCDLVISRAFCALSWFPHFATQLCASGRTSPCRSLCSQRLVSVVCAMLACFLFVLVDKKVSKTAGRQHLRILRS